MTTTRKGQWILTASGRAYWPGDPREEEVEIEDIAAALSKLCRFTGHTMKFYSVAEHSIYVSDLVPPHLALEGLLHDASEAYCADLNRPLKVQLPSYKKIEDQNSVVIRKKFGLPLTEDPLVKKADLDMLLMERYQVMPIPKHNLKWTWGGEERPESEIRIVGFNPCQAEYFFLKRFHELYTGV